MREGRLEVGWWREEGKEGNEEGTISQALGVGTGLLETMVEGDVAIFPAMEAWDFLFKRLRRLAAFLDSGVMPRGANEVAESMV